MGVGLLLEMTMFALGSRALSLRLSALQGLVGVQAGIIRRA